jgi:hypothetical protein
VGQVKEQEVESRIIVWHIAEVSKVNNHFKLEEVIIMVGGRLCREGQRLAQQVVPLQSSYPSIRRN